MKKKKGPALVVNELLRAFRMWKEPPVVPTPDKAEHISIDVTGAAPKFSWLSPGEQEHFEMWLGLYGHTADYKSYRSMGRDELAAWASYLEHVFEYEITTLYMDADSWKRDHQQLASSIDRALIKGPIVKKYRKQAINELFAERWREHARTAWDQQREERKAGGSTPLSTYAEMAKEILRAHTAKPVPSLTAIREAIDGLRFTLDGRVRKNAKPKNRGK